MKKFASLILIPILLLCGCTNTPPPEQLTEQQPEQPVEYEYHNQEITYSEPAEQYAFRIKTDCTETAFARYYFESAVEHADRAACIQATDKILSKQKTAVSLPEIYVFTEQTYPDVYVKENKLYLSYQDWESVEYTANVLLAAYGAYSHYGLAYGYANLLCNTPTSGNTFTPPTLADACDLNLLCFDPAFVSEDDLSSVKLIAHSFAQAYNTEKGEDALQALLSDSDTAEGAISVSSALEKFYRDNGFDYTPSNLRFGYGGHAFDYLLFTDFGTFYIRNNWKDINTQYNPLVYDGFLHQNYADTKEFFQINLAQMKQYQELFALDSYNNDLSIIFANTNLSQTSFYQVNTHTIYVKNVDSLMHEYIHALTQHVSSAQAWKIEGFARYYSYRYDYYGMALLNWDYNNTEKTLETKYVQEYLEKIQRPIDMAKDYQDIENIAVWCYSLRDPDGSYLAGSSFVQYLVNQYGDQAVINSICGDQTPLPKTYHELVRDWIGHIESHYQDYSKYES